MLTLCGCSHWSWNPFKKEPEAPPPPVEMLSIESLSPNPASDRFAQSWEGVRLMVDVYSDTGIGRAAAAAH